MAARAGAEERRSKKRVRPGASGVQLGEATVRAMVLQGAAEVFAERGVRMAAVEDLLKASGVSRRTFYRFYASKEDVMVVLYELGTEALLDACRRAVAEETDPLRRIARCIDAHLENARGLGRLVFVLGGEAQRQESALHARRMHVHDELVALLAGAHDGVDPLVFRALVLALEGVTRITLEEGDEGRAVTDAGIARTRRVMMRLATSTLAGEGPGVAPMPRAG